MPESPLPPTLLLFTLAMPLAAMELTDLAGDWTLAELRSPTRLREIYFNTVTNTNRTSTDSLDFAKENEFINFAYYPDPLLTETRSFSFSPTGAVSGGESGQVLSISKNRISYSDGIDLTTV